MNEILKDRMADVSDAHVAHRLAIEQLKDAISAVEQTHTYILECEKAVKEINN